MDKKMAGIIVVAFLFVLSVGVGSILLFSNSKKSQANDFTSASFISVSGETITIELSSDNYMQDALDLVPKFEEKVDDMSERLSRDYANDSTVQLELRLESLNNQINNCRNEIYIKNQTEYTEDNTGRLGLSYVNQTLVDIVTEINEIDSEINITE